MRRIGDEQRVRPPLPRQLLHAEAALALLARDAAHLGGAGLAGHLRADLGRQRATRGGAAGLVHHRPHRLAHQAQVRSGMPRLGQSSGRLPRTGRPPMARGQVRLHRARPVASRAVIVASCSGVSW